MADFDALMAVAKQNGIRVIPSLRSWAPWRCLRPGMASSRLAPRHRAVLAYLLLHAGTVVSAERLIGAVWGQDPPDTARAQVHAAVTAIRRVLRAAGADQLLASRAAGYVISPGAGTA